MSAIDDVAADYVLGLLGEDEAKAVEKRITAPSTAEDEALALAVGSLRDTLLPLDLSAQERALPSDAWDRLAARLEQKPPAPAHARRSIGRRGAGRAERSRMNSWRSVAIAASVAAIALALTVFWQARTAVSPAVVAVLLDAGGSPVAVLEVSADNTVLVTPFAGVDAQPSEVFQVWTKPDADGPPVSVGLLEEAARMVVRNPALPRPSSGQLYEITVEPAGGSPTGLPTGRVVGIGNARVPASGDF